MEDKSFKPKALFLTKVNKFKVKRYLPVAGLLLTLVLLFYGYFLPLKVEEVPQALQLPLEETLYEEPIIHVTQEVEPVEEEEPEIAIEAGPIIGPPMGARPLPYIDLDAMVTPVSGRIVADFGWREDSNYGDWRYHSGVDISTPSGALVLAAFTGRVKDIERVDLDRINLVLEHSGGISTIYSGPSIALVHPGEIVEEGQAIARMKTSDTGESLLHFRMMVGDTFVDPSQYLK